MVPLGKNATSVLLNIKTNNQGEGGVPFALDKKGVVYVQKHNCKRGEIKTSQKSEENLSLSLH